MVGSIALPATAPRRVPRFQNEYKAKPVNQNAMRWARGSLWPTDIAVVSSIVNCAARSRVANRPSIRRDIARPYTPLRAASNNAPPSAEPNDPPAPITLTAENCDAPVKTRSERAHVCAIDAPAATDPTPNDTPKTPTAMLSVVQATIIGRRL